MVDFCREFRPARIPRFWMTKCELQRGQERTSAFCFSIECLRGVNRSESFEAALVLGQMPSFLMGAFINIECNAFFVSVDLSPPLSVAFCTVKVFGITVAVTAEKRKPNFSSAGLRATNARNRISHIHTAPLNCRVHALDTWHVPPLPSSARTN